MNKEWLEIGGGSQQISNGHSVWDTLCVTTVDSNSNIQAQVFTVNKSNWSF
jgi:hypothetical protein